MPDVSLTLESINSIIKLQELIQLRRRVNADTQDAMRLHSRRCCGQEWPGAHTAHKDAAPAPARWCRHGAHSLSLGRAVGGKEAAAVSLPVGAQRPSVSRLRLSSSDVAP